MRYTWVWLLVAVFAAGCSTTTNTTTESSDMAQGQSNITDLQKTDVQVGAGAEAAAGQQVTVHYTGWLYDASKDDKKGTKFDSSRDRKIGRAHV